MKITLSKFIQKHYNDINYLGTVCTKRHKQYIRIENTEKARELCNTYDNIKLVYGIALYAPETTKAYITLK